MRVVTRYIFRQLFTVTLFVTGALTLAVWLSQSLRFMDWIVNRGLPVSDFALFMTLLLPQFFGVVLPIAAFVAVVFVYNKLLNESELIVLRSAGLSQFQLAKPALVLAIIVTVMVYAISLYLLPVGYRAFKDLQHRIRHNYSSILLQEGVFNTLSDNLTVYVRDRGPEGELRGILVHKQDEGEEPVTMIASRGAIVQTDQSPRVLLVDGNRQVVDHDSGKLSVLYFDRYTVDIEQLQESIGSRWRQPKERFLHNLLWPAETGNDRRYRSELIVEAHRRLTFPLYTLVFVGIGLAAMLAGEFSRRGQMKRILAAVLAVALLQALQLALTQLSVRTPSLIPLMYLAVVVALGTTGRILLRHPGRPRTSSRPELGPEVPAR